MWCRRREIEIEKGVSSAGDPLFVISDSIIFMKVMVSCLEKKRYYNLGGYPNKRILVGQ